MRGILISLLALCVSGQTPTITSIIGLNGANPLNLLTVGGEQLVLTGSNFGPSGAQLTYIGPSPFQNGFTVKYTPLIIRQNDTTIQFSTSPGIGANLQFTVTTTGSVTSPVLAAYALPVITNITVPTGTTLYTTKTLRPVGGDTIIINAQNLGPRTYPGYANIYMPTVRFGGTTGTYGWLNTCIRSTTTFDSQITCRLPVGGGTNHTVRIQSGATGQWSLINLRILISYVTPTLVSSSPTLGFMNTAGLEQIIVRGQNMPYPSWVIAGYCPVTASFGPYTSTIDVATDRYGSDLPGSPIVLPSSDPALCIAQCKNNILCQSWALSQVGCGTTTKANCWLKGAIPNPTPSTCVTSGQMTSPPLSTPMRSCTGAFDTDGKTPVLTCQTPAGTGTGYALSLNVGNLYTNILANRVIGYAPPIVYNFAGANIDANTLGNETVLINGQNFGANASLVSATYTLNLKQLTQNISQFSYISPRCNVTIPHTQLGCVTAPGVGQNLAWNIVVDKQNNVNPTTGYASPTITKYEILNATNGVQLPAAPTSGGALLYIMGSGFGYPLLDLVQSVFMQSLSGTLIPLYNYTLVSDSLIVAPLPVGGGSGWQAVIKIADISNIPSTANFSYANPTVLNLSPSTGPTTGSTLVTVQASNLASDPNVITAVAFGNPIDGSLYPMYIPTNRVPNSGNLSSTPYIPGYLTFLTPPGVGAQRQIRLVSYLALDAQPDISALPSVTTLNQDTFTYDPPLIQSAVLSIPQTPIQIQMATNFFGSASDVSVLTLYGLNFGPPVPLTGRTIEYQNTTGWQPTTTTFFYDLSQWSDTIVTLYTQVTVGAIRVTLVSQDPNGSLNNQTSNGYTYSNLSPFISTSNTTLYPTIGAAVLEIQAMFLSAATNLNMSIASSPCPILDPTTKLPLNPQDIYSRIINNPAVYSPPGPFTQATQWTIQCLVPQGQGSAVPVILTRLPDTAQSQPLYISYMAPQIITMNGQPAGSFTRIRSPTQGSQLDIYGTNLGPCPTVTVATVTILTCSDQPGSVSSDHTHVQLQLPAGEGIGLSLNPPNGWQIQLIAGDQLAIPFLFGWLPPTLTSLSAPSYPTIGGTTVTIQGINFGQSLPLWPQATLPPDLQIQVQLSTASPCINPVRLSHTIITCILPEGAGYINAALLIAGQASTNSIQAHYDNPTFVAAGFNGTVNTSTTVPTTGAQEFFIVGNNFGPSPTNSCVFVSNSQVQQTPTCNNLEDYAGEGEIPATNILSWNHTQIHFVMPPGTGSPIIHVSAAQIYNAPQAPLRIQYAPPIIQSISMNHGPSLGAYPIQLSGMGFGKKTQAQTYPLALPLAPNQQFYNNIQVFMSTLCLSTVPTLNCQTLITDYVDNTISLTMPPGIGTNYSFQVVILDSPSITSQSTTLWSYDPPLISGFNPNPVYIGAQTTPNVVITGLNFGSNSVFNLFPNADPMIEIDVDSLQQVQPTRIQRDNIDVGIQFILTGNLLTAGAKTTAIKIGGQWGYSANSSFSALTMFCQTNYFARNKEVCLKCPTGGNCPGGLDYPAALPGFYNINSTLQMADPCPSSNIVRNPDQSPRDVCIVACSPSEACVGNNRCAYGYMSQPPVYRCNMCAPSFYKRANECIPCPNSPIMLVIGFLLVVIFLAAAGYFLNKYNVNMAFVSIAIDYFQVISIFLNSKIQWPAAIKNLMYVLSAFNLNIDIVAPECLIPNINYEQKFYFIMLTPVALFGLLLTANVLYVGYKATCLGRKRKDLIKYTATLQSSAIILMYFFYLYLTRTIMDVFNCTPTVPPSYDSNNNVIKYMSVQFEQCGKPGGLQLRLLPFAIIALVLYSLGFPTALASLLYKNHELIILDQLLRAKGVTSDRFHNPHAYDIRKAFGRIYYQFKPNFFYWALIVLLRKFLIAITSVIFATNSSFQMAACLLILFLAYSAQSQFRPFMCYDDYVDVLDNHNALAEYLPLHTKLRTMMTSVETRNLKTRRKNILTRTGKIDKTALFHSVWSWFFNYNTVESTMLFCGVIVCLMGIMYQSETIASGADATGIDAITGVILTVIISSILYLASVFILEIYLALQNNKPSTNTHIMNSKVPRSARHLTTIQEEVLPPSTESNPLMIQQSLQKQFDLTEYDEPPPKIIWQMFKELYEKQQDDIKSITAEAQELKKDKQKNQILTQGTFELSPLHMYKRQASRTTFAPVIKPGSEKTT